MSNLGTLKDIKFTTCYRKTVFIYTETTFTEADFVKQLSEANKATWTGLTLEARGKIWAKLEKNFPFETSSNNMWDPHTNWIEDWDTEESIEKKVRWDYHPWIKETIGCAVVTVEKESLDS